MKGKEIQEKLVSTMENWQKIEQASVESCREIASGTNNPLVKQVMGIIEADSQLHAKVQQFIADTMTKQAVNIDPEEIGKVWSAIENHINIEKKMVGFVEETLSAIRGRKLLVQEYLLEYLRADEKKHDMLLESLEKIKKGMYPYAG